MRQVLLLSGWTIGYVAANQVSVIVVRNLADPGSGDAAAYFDAFTFFIFPYGLLGVSIATTFVPDLARSVVRRDKPAFMAPVVARPADDGAADAARPACCCFVLRRPIIGAFLQHGQYEPADALDTSNALGGFALGLVGLSVYVFALRGFYAHQDTRTPFVINVVENLLNIVLALVLVGRYGVLGLGLAFALAYLISSVWAIQVLSYKVPGFPIGEVFASFWRMIVAGALAGEVAWLVAGTARRRRRRHGGAGPAWSSARSSASWSTSASSWSCVPPSWPPFAPSSPGACLTEPILSRSPPI